MMCKTVKEVNNHNTKSDRTESTEPIILSSAPPRNFTPQASRSKDNIQLADSKLNFKNVREIRELINPFIALTP